LVHSSRDNHGEVSRLIDPAMLVEIEADAMIVKDDSDTQGRQNASPSASTTEPAPAEEPGLATEALDEALARVTGEAPPKVPALAEAAVLSC
jgi:hypothetical protein